MESTWLVDKNALTVTAFASREAADTATKGRELSDSMQLIRYQSEIEGWPSKLLLAFYNKLGNKSATKFADRQTGLNKVWALIVAQRPEAADQQPAEERTKKPKTKREASPETDNDPPADAAAQSSADANNEGDEEMAKTNKRTSRKVRHEPKARSGERRERLKGDFKIKLVAPENPRRKDTEGWKSWNKLKDGMLLSEARKRGARTVDIRWDADHGHLKLLPVKSAA